jgi:molybdopterin-guanine dinucleotide biosynthesis protein A
MPGIFMKHRTVAVFAGGQSSRMGRDKALLPVLDSSLLERTAQVALSVTSSVVIVGRPRPENWSLDQVRFIPDDEADLGPLGALQTLLKREAEAMVIACDMPKLESEALEWLTEQAGARSGEDGLIVQNGDRWEPLFSFYRAECLPLIESQLAINRRSMHALIRAGEFAFVKAPEEIRPMLANANTPEEWQALTSANDC